MIVDPPVTVWTVGHSTHAIDAFIDILRHHRLEILVDVRRFPASRRVPHFGSVALQEALVGAGIRYQHLVELGGRRPVRPGSRNGAWRNASFQGYADYMETQAFRDGIARLVSIAREGRTTVMCSEALWWRCHRSMIADYLQARGVQVLHILDARTVQEHAYRVSARMVEGQFSYAGSREGPPRRARGRSIR